MFKNLHFYIGLIIFIITVIFGAGKIQAQIMDNTGDISQLSAYYRSVSSTMSSIDRRLAKIEGRLYRIQKSIN